MTAQLRHYARAAAIAGIMALSSGMAQAEDGKDVSRSDNTGVVELGRSIAETHCAKCHSIGKTGDSPLAMAPPLRDFAAKWPLDQLEEALAEGIVTGHPDMPEFTFNPDEITGLIAFLDELSD